MAEDLTSLPARRQPIAPAAGTNQSADEFAVVTLNGSGSSDPDGDAITHAWSQTSGTTVTITNADMAQATFDAPDVLAADSSAILVFQLAVSDGSRTTSATTQVTVNDVGLGANSPPVANAGPDQNVGEVLPITLDGTGSVDADGDVFSYSWAQLGGPSVMLMNGGTSQPMFTSPNVGASPEILTFELTVDDGIDSTMDTVDITVQEVPTSVSVSGRLQFEWVNPKANCRGLNLAFPVPRAMRGVTVQLLEEADRMNVLATATTDENGDYSFATVPPLVEVVVRARAELKSAGPATWDVEVRDNVDLSASPPPLTRRPLYVVDFASFNTGAANTSDADFIATTGWDTISNSYTGDRQAAPFAILDSVMDAMTMVTDVDPGVSFPALDVYWSVDNTPTSPEDIDAGELSSTFYSNSGLYMLGDANVDTEEFDDHVSIHEWGHYFEDNFSRSDSIGGGHFIGSALDPRVAFGEGFASALAAIALDNPLYCDTSSPLLTQGFDVDWETGDSFLRADLQGWFNEWSVGAMIYDLWDTGVDSTDNSSIGFAPIYNTMTGPQRVTASFTTLFSFAAGLRPMLNAADLAFADSQFNRVNVDTAAAVDEWGDSQTTAPTNSGFPDGRDVIPVYTEMVVGAPAVNVCVNNDYYQNWADGDGDNKFGMFKFLRFTTTGTATYNITATANPPLPSTTVRGDPSPRDDSDPDLFLHRSGTWFPFAQSTEDGDATETLNVANLGAGTYLLRLQEWRHVDVERDPNFQSQVCFDISVGP